MTPTHHAFRAAKPRFVITEHVDASGQPFVEMRDPVLDISLIAPASARDRLAWLFRGHWEARHKEATANG